MPRTVFDPTTPLETNAFTYAPRPVTLDGLRIGLVENTKINSKELLCKLAERLGRRYGTCVAHLDRKASSGHAVGDETLALFCTEVDIALAGIGD